MIPDTFNAPDGGCVVVPLFVEYHTVYVIPDPDTTVHETLNDTDSSDIPLVMVTSWTCGGGGGGVVAKMWRVGLGLILIHFNQIMVSALHVQRILAFQLYIPDLHIACILNELMKHIHQVLLYGFKHVDSGNYGCEMNHNSAHIHNRTAMFCN